MPLLLLAIRILRRPAAGVVRVPERLELRRDTVRERPSPFDGRPRLQGELDGRHPSSHRVDRGRDAPLSAALHPDRVRSRFDLSVGGPRRRPGIARGDRAQAGYLNPPFFVVRTVFYFARLHPRGRSLAELVPSQRRAAERLLVHGMRMLSGGAIPVLSLCLTWASFDWTMSLQPDWYSTIFGLYTFAGGFVGAIALVCILLHLSRRATPDHAQALGRLLLAMTIFWAYMAFSQLLIYWIGDVPEEIRYYRLRTTGSWTVVTVILIFGHFFIPFFALLNRRWKRHERFLVVIGVDMVAMHFVDVYWLILPVHDVHRGSPALGRSRRPSLRRRAVVRVERAGLCPRPAAAASRSGARERPRLRGSGMTNSEGEFGVFQEEDILPGLQLVAVGASSIAVGAAGGLRGRAHPLSHGRVHPADRGGSRGTAPSTAVDRAHRADSDLERPRWHRREARPRAELQRLGWIDRSAGWRRFRSMTPSTSSWRTSK